MLATTGRAEPVITGDALPCKSATAATVNGHVRKDASAAQAGFACALHMHQPTIPAGENGGLISNLEHMMNNPHDGDNHNASVFASCYARMGDIIPCMFCLRTQRVLKDIA
jgi:hypothetical protein